MGRNAVWYPTVFPDRCDGCEGLEVPRCIEFCPHNVFGMRDGKAVVLKPQNCVYGCVACESVCPRKAIVFPQRTMTLPKTKKQDKGLLHKVECRICGKSSGQTEMWTYALTVKLKKKIYNESME